jgi:hypothetical protein
VSLGTFILLLLVLASPVAPAWALTKRSDVIQDFSKTYSGYLLYYGTIVVALGIVLLLARLYLRWVLAIYRGNHVARLIMVIMCAIAVPQLLFIAAVDDDPRDNPIGLVLSTPVYLLVIALLCAPSANRYFQQRRP